MSGWKPDERHRHEYGPFSMVPERDGTETAHLVTLHDGRMVRVMPDDHSSGQKRSQTIVKALKAMHAVWGSRIAVTDEDGVTLVVDPMTILVGFLSEASLTWQPIQDLTVLTIEDFLDEWFGQHIVALRIDTGEFLHDLDEAGWEIVRKESG